MSSLQCVALSDNWIDTARKGLFKFTEYNKKFSGEQVLVLLLCGERFEFLLRNIINCFNGFAFLNLAYDHALSLCMFGQEYVFLPFNWV